MQDNKNIKYKEFLKNLNHRTSINPNSIVVAKVIFVHKQLVGLYNSHLKSEATVAIREFIALGVESPQIGEEYEVYYFLDEKGKVAFSYERAHKENELKRLNKLMQDKSVLEIVITEKTKSSFIVSFDSAMNGFLPFAHCSIIETNELAVGSKLEARIYRIDSQKSKIYFASIKSEENSTNILEGKILKSLGTPTNNTATEKNQLQFLVEINGKEVNILSTHKFAEGEVVRIRVYNNNYVMLTPRSSLDIKENTIVKMKVLYNESHSSRGKIIEDHNGQILEDGPDTILYWTELSWAKRNISLPAVSKELSVFVKSIDRVRKQVHVSLKRCGPNLFQEFAAAHKAGEILVCNIVGVYNNNIIVNIHKELDAIIDNINLTWEDRSAAHKIVDDINKKLSVRTSEDEKLSVEVKILDIDQETEKVTLSLKHLKPDPMILIDKIYSAGSTIVGIVQKIERDYVTVEIEGYGNIGYISKAGFPKDKPLSVLDKVTAKVLKVEKENRRLQLSVSAYEKDKNDKALEKYGSQESYSTLGDIESLTKILKDE